MRKLATIRQVKELKPIEGADIIELAKVDGWQCVVKKGEFSEGDYGIYYEIDSFLPEEDSRYEFLRSRGVKALADGSRGFRLKTIKLRGQLSQGLLLPLDNFPELTNPNSNEFIENVRSGMDVTDLLDIRLYEPPIPAQLAGKVKGSFPGWISKTDQERIQNLPEYFEQYQDIEFEITEKLDGTSMTVFYRDGDFGVCSRNLNLHEDETNSLWKAARVLDLGVQLGKLGRNIALQGELVGEGIQKNKYRLKGQKWFVFDVFDIDHHRYMTPNERNTILTLLDNVQSVPQLATEKIFKRFSTMEQLLLFAEGHSTLYKTQREGIVAKSIGLVNQQVLSFKVINNKYLLKHGD